MIERVASFEEIDVWLIGLDATFDHSILSAHEIARTEGCLDPVYAQRLLASRVGLRTVLSGYVGAAPARLTFSRTRSGAPVLVDDPECCFSLSRSRDLAVVAVGFECRVGVDIQGPAPSAASCDALARHVLDEEERLAFDALGADERRVVFLAAWTRREAALKAMDFGLLDDRAPAPDETGKSALASSGWRLLRPVLAPQRVVALVSKPRTPRESAHERTTGVRLART